ncbi:MAG TPA: transglycosylase domain-containing protein [Candidatus Stackebrandtia excrementipullorum]|nr:transglycosylase domain-containing protein [Candidatus Stackebrandtia excrementipullorum]
MSDYGPRGYGRDPDDHGWPGRDGGRGDAGQGGYGGSDRYGPSYGSGDYGASGRGGGSYDGYGSQGRSGSQGGSDSGSAYGASGMPTSGGGYGAHEEPTTGRARVPAGGDSTGPGRARGSARVSGKPGRGRALTDEEAEALAKAKKKKKRRRRWIALGCVVAIMMGMITVVGSLFFQNVPLPKDVIEKELAQNTTINFSDGSQMAKIGEEASNRVNVKYDDIPHEVVMALVAGEDAKFFEHGGVDFWGVMRALWNNVTGGQQQGASTLTQQYVGQVMKIRGDDSYLRKANEAVMAMKMDDEYSKKEIIEFYMNLVYMGRGAYGLGAAIKAWYGDDQTLEDLTASQAAVIFAQVKSPNGALDPRNPCGECGLEDDEAYAAAEGRWKYFLNAMLEMKELTPERHAEFMEEGMPETAETQAVSASEGYDEDTGFVSHKYVIDEAERQAGIDKQDLMTGGYTITTTIDPDLQQAAVDSASRSDDGTMSVYPDNLRAALVSIDPETGAVVAYFGGTTDGTGVDKAGHESMHPPGSSFKEFTLLTALENNVSIESMWDGSSPREYPERVDGNGEPIPVTNSGGASEPRISLHDTIVQSLNTPIYTITNEFGANRVMLLARNMGINKIGALDSDGNAIVLDLWDPEVEEMLLNDELPRQVVDNEIGFGQYPVSVFDMAVANATLANEGLYREPHFIKEIVDKNGEVVYEAQPGVNLTEREAVNPGSAADAIFVSAKIHPNVGSGYTPSGVPTAGKTGTWERHCPDNPGCTENSAIWYAGFSPQLSAAVWIGDKESENGDVRDEYGNPAYGAGPSGTVWQAYMNAATQVDGYNDSSAAFPVPPKSGDKNAGDAKEEKPDDDDDRRDDCRPGDDDCDEERPGDGDCDPADPACCQPGDPGCIPECDPVLDPTCEEQGDNDGQGQNERVVPFVLATAPHSEPYALREDYAFIT